MRNAFGIAALACSLLVLESAAARAGGGYSPLEIEMKALNGSKLAGTATLTQNGLPTSLLVSIDYKNVVFIPETMYPAHIHEGTCTKLDPKPVYPLAPMNSGRSLTDLKATVTLKQLMDTPHAIVVHDPNNLGRYISCGNIALKTVSGSGY
jgi:hypothetical protein